MEETPGHQEDVHQLRVGEPIQVESHSRNGSHFAVFPGLASEWAWRRANG
jgi:hypothetical protein